jgi:hypothetical protein
MGVPGRPTKYKAEYDKQAFKMCLLGATDKQLADFFEVEEQTVNNWKIDYPSFFVSIKAGKEDADYNIAKSLYDRARGYSCPEEKVFMSDGMIVTHDTTKHYPPDTTAAIFWLKNRQSKNWRDKNETELTGKDGSDFTINVKITDE